MTRLGWGILGGIVLLGALFASMLSFGPGGGRGRAVVPSGAPPVRQVGALALPVAGVDPAALTDTWNQPRAGGARAHHAIDIMAPRRTPVLAAAPGRVEKLFVSGDGGNTVYVRSADGTTVYYYAHLDDWRPGLAEGQRVRIGDPIGTVGSTGNASPEAPHLHFAVKRMRAGERWWQGEAVNPYPLLVGSAASR